MKKCIITVYYLIDNFCKIYQDWERKRLIPSSNQRNRDGKLSLAELLTITIYFYLSPCKDFKNYYLYYLRYKYKEYFCLPSYSTIIQLLPRMLLPLAVLMHYLKGEETGIYYIDSTKLAICHNKRISSNRVFNRFSKIGKSSYGWFLGFKLHLIINNKGEIMSVKITKGNKSDLSVASVISKGLSGKLFGDKAYISKELFHQLFSNGLRLFTNLRKDMKTYLLDIDDKLLLNKRSLIESVFNVLKKHMHLEHTRHRSHINFFVHIIASLASYSISKLNPYLISSSFSSNHLS
ncbi:IS982 family transposase [Orientia tsutsugamushi]|uniref:Transposase n=2 Tax=Orientia tsutsugamushi TaxID=784 RepID=A0A2U3RNY2_ORITS|nr:IS982 family transposase [Orientia tsutsugamushi]SPR14388.1 transposase [Orientia tsutsugamushi]SPR14858.1 transposase [Orientia tsutsugamushi]SPR14934.1 transposase [Orientia tsutsugamushi]